MLRKQFPFGPEALYSPVIRHLRKSCIKNHTKKTLEILINLDKIKLFNSVNLREGYNILKIRTPREVIGNE
jgi:hypothetical protein